MIFLSIPQCNVKWTFPIGRVCGCLTVSLASLSYGGIASAIANPEPDCQPVSQTSITVGQVPDSKSLAVADDSNLEFLPTAPLCSNALNTTQMALCAEASQPSSDSFEGLSLSPAKCFRDQARSGAPVDDELAARSEDIQAANNEALGEHQSEPGGIQPELRAQETNMPSGPPRDSELGEIRVRSTVEDPELGILRIREQPILTSTSQPPTPVAYLTGRVGYINSDNIFLGINEQLGIVGDDFFRYGAALSFYPALGPQTFLLATAETNFQRYTSVTEASYDQVRFRVGVRQGLFPRTYGEVGWSYQQLFRPGYRDRFFENHGFDVTLGRRDPLAENLLLSSYYRLQLNLSEPASFDRVIQAFGTYAGYEITPNLEFGLNYQLTLADYTQQQRYDTYHQVLGQFVYSLTPRTRVSLFGGFSFGRSSDETVRFNDTIFGVFLESSLVLF